MRALKKVSEFYIIVFTLCEEWSSLITHLGVGGRVTNHKKNSHAQDLSFGFFSRETFYCFKNDNSF